MGTMFISSLLLILAGSIIMSLSVLRAGKSLKHSGWYVIENNSKIRYLYKFHLLLMIFFLVGYVLVFMAIVMDLAIISMPFIGAIFFFGSIFVFIGIFIHSFMLTVCKEKHFTVSQQNKHLFEITDAMIYMMAYQTDLRDSDTGGHVERTSRLVEVLVKKLAKNSKYISTIDDKYITRLVKSAPLHDIGKIQICDSILKKNGKLTFMELKQMMKHCEYGAEMLKKAMGKISFPAFLPIAIEITTSHHERWDGKGYPQGLKAEEIPLSARIMSVADVFDALVSKRCYKDAYSLSESFKIIVEEKGTQFAPDVIDAFIASKDEFFEIYNSSVNELHPPQADGVSKTQTTIVLNIFVYSYDLDLPHISL